MILIASCYYQNNYGSKLQAYALQTFLDRMKIENRTINYNGLKKHITWVKILYYVKNIIKIDMFRSQLNKFFFKLIILVNPKLKRRIELRKSAMRKFTVEKFRLTKVCSQKQLSDLCSYSKSAAVIVGSDQLWLPSNIYADYYTLNFVPVNVKRISYATSFGLEKIDKSISLKAKKFLDKFDFISVREESGAQIIRQITTKKAEIVCDPTMFFSSAEWIDILNLKEEKENNGYIFCYFLGNNTWQRKWVKDFAQKKDLKIKAIVHIEEYVKCDVGYADEELYDIDPAEFVSLIQKAMYICTDSFHGTVFSLLFHKQFFSFRRFNSNYSANTNSRLDSLLEPLMLKNRIITSQDYSIPSNKIDYDIVDIQISNFRIKSSEWLINSIIH